MYRMLLLFCLCAWVCTAWHSQRSQTGVARGMGLGGRGRSAPHRALATASNSDLFGGGGSDMSSRRPPQLGVSGSAGAAALRDEATKLRQEAAEMEIALREEARSKGVPEELINKLIPIRQPKGVTMGTTESGGAEPAQQSTTTSTMLLEKPAAQSSSSSKSQTPEELRAELGVFPTGNAVLFTQSLDRLKSKGLLRAWSSKPVPVSFAVTQTTFKMKTGLEPQQLKLDSPGFNYVNTLGIAVAGATVCALASNQVGGQGKY